MEPQGDPVHGICVFPHGCGSVFTFWLWIPPQPMLWHSFLNYYRITVMKFHLKGFRSYLRFTCNIANSRKRGSLILCKGSICQPRCPGFCLGRPEQFNVKGPSFDSAFRNSLILKDCLFFECICICLCLTLNEPRFWTWNLIFPFRRFVHINCFWAFTLGI